jgi:hypothetical protein
MLRRPKRSKNEVVAPEEKEEEALTEELNNFMCLAPLYTNEIVPFSPCPCTCPTPFVLLRWYGTTP